jgi:tetratricopeptide (TPR) repeat protein
MVYFQVSRIGFNCGKEKDLCTYYPEHCKECVTNYFTQIGFDVDQNIKISMIDSEEKRIQMHQTIIWHKFLDVLNIKHIILFTKHSGLLVVDYPVSGGGINVEFLTGFIQANIMFSSSGKTLDNSASNMKQQHKFYEFQYETFDILIKNGAFIRACLVLDQKASESLKHRVVEFLTDYERTYSKKIERLLRTGILEFEDTINFIIETFNIRLVFPMVLTHTLLPDDLEAINKNIIQKAIIDFANEFLASKKFFFIHNLLNKVQEIVNLSPHVILYEIYQLLEKNIIIYSNIETVEDEVRKFQESRATRIADNELISPIIANDDAMGELKGRAVNMHIEEAQKLIDQYLKKGETAEKALAYKEAQKEYEKALYLASGFDLKLDIGRISFIVLELDKKIKGIEIDYCLEAGEKAEKKKDYINAIQHFKQAIDLLSDESIFKGNGSESKIKKLEKRVLNLQKLV